MRVAIIDTPSVNVLGGGQFLCRDLRDNLIKYGHEAKIFDLVHETSPLRHYLTNALIATQLDFDFADMVIPVSNSAWFVEHENSVPWIIRQNSAAYEWYDYQDYGGFKQFESEGDVFRKLITNADIACLKAKKKIYTISPMVTEILYDYCGLEAETLTVPFASPDWEFVNKEYGEFIFYPGRFVRSKRPLLAIQAMKYVKSNVRLLIAGAINDKQYGSEIKKYIKENQLEDRVSLIDRFFSDDEKTKWFAGCLGTLYFGFLESYWSIVSTESAFCSKPIIATTDSGATKYLVIDGETGYRPEPTPQAIAEAMDKMYMDRKKTARMGNEINKHIRTLIPTWETVVKKLTGVG